MIRLVIHQIDFFSFRDGRPFLAGESHVASSLFPPTPLTFQGAVRSILWAEGEDVGDGEHFGSLRMMGPFIWKNGKEFFPLPLDVGVDEEGRKIEYAIPSQLDGVFFNPLYLGEEVKEVFLPLRKKGKTGTKKYVSRDVLGDILLSREFSPEEIKEEGEFIEREVRTGIAREKTKTAKEGYLYHIEVIRLKEGTAFSLYVDETTGSKLKDKGFMMIGGEKRGAGYIKDGEWRDIEHTEEIKRRVKETGKFKLVLLMPTFLDKIPEIEGAKCCGVVTGKYLSLGGWDLKKNKMKPMKKAVPPGSVFFYSDFKGDVEELFQRYHWDSLMDGEERKIGMGLCAVGTW